MRVEALWTITRAAIAAGLTAVMLFHWQVTEANATVTVAPVHGEILFAEPVPSGHWESVGTYRVTHYCPCKRCNGRNAGKTASGAEMTLGRTVAAKGYPFGTKLRINGQTYTVEDRGVPARCVDILVETHEGALRRGMYYTEVFVWRERAE